MLSTIGSSLGLFFNINLRLLFYHQDQRNLLSETNLFNRQLENWDMDRQKVCKGGHILEIWQDKRDCYIFRNRSVERGRNERIRKRQTESLRRSSTTCAASRKIPELVNIFWEKKIKIKSQCEMKVKTGRQVV